MNILIYTLSSSCNPYSEILKYSGIKYSSIFYTRITSATISSMDMTLKKVQEDDPRTINGRS